MVPLPSICAVLSDPRVMALGWLGEGEGDLWGVHRVLVIYSSGDDSDLVVQKASSLRVPSKDDMIHVYGITFYTNSFCWWGGKRRLTGHGARLQWNVMCLLSFAPNVLGPWDVWCARRQASSTLRISVRVEFASKKRKAEDATDLFANTVLCQNLQISKIFPLEII